MCPSGGGLAWNYLVVLVVAAVVRSEGGGSSHFEVRHQSATEPRISDSYASVAGAASLKGTDHAFRPFYSKGYPSKGDPPASTPLPAEDRLFHIVYGTKEKKMEDDKEKEGPGKEGGMPPRSSSYHHYSGDSSAAADLQPSSKYSSYVSVGGKRGALHGDDSNSVYGSGFGPPRHYYHYSGGPDSGYSPPHPYHSDSPQTLKGKDVLPLDSEVEDSKVSVGLGVRAVLLLAFVIIIVYVLTYDMFNEVTRLGRESAFDGVGVSGRSVAPSRLLARLNNMDDIFLNIVERIDLAEAGFDLMGIDQESCRQMTFCNLRKILNIFPVLEGYINHIGYDSYISGRYAEGDEAGNSFRSCRNSFQECRTYKISL